MYRIVTLAVPLDAAECWELLKDVTLAELVGVPPAVLVGANEILEGLGLRMLLIGSAVLVYAAGFLVVFRLEGHGLFVKADVTAPTVSVPV